ncbi:uncharacterized protein SOCE26_006110 [Sorangium cellulosum]|uniref:Uncharacterized protein n=1 Tax=Sorangium cellulosum TaxID=56 RepID=A0A2L0EIW9_SORCE|nr:hypothetical protein [Sorangium cellulosum]AUX39227.1 uncharacterized protein SOCE26_006110 [Sorangium cellulosum]
MPDAEERLTLAICAFVAGCILLAPREWVSAGLAIALSLALLAWHVVRQRAGTPPTHPAPPAHAAAGAQRFPGGEPRDEPGEPS